MKGRKQQMDKKKGRKRRYGMHFIPYDYEAAFNKNLEDLHELFAEQMLNHRYKYIYALKEITSGEQFEVEIYPEFTKISDVPKEGRIKKDNSKAQKNLNDKNAQKYVERLINENFGDSDLWITLTYGAGQEPQNWGEAIRNMQNYIDRINYRRKKKKLPIARYIYITEYAPEEEIRWHHHLVMDGMLDMDTVEAAWKKSSRNEVRRTKKDEHGLTGMAIYITKDKHREKGERRWNCSKNLSQPRIRKVHSKRPTATSGTYKPIGKYVDGFVKDHNSIEEQMRKWYPDCIFTESGVYYNDFNGMFYIKARMRRKQELTNRTKTAMQHKKIYKTKRAGKEDKKYMRDIVKALTTIPATDGNFMAALHYASKEELERAISTMKEDVNGKHKSRTASCERELRKREKGK